MPKTKIIGREIRGDLSSENKPLVVSMIKAGFLLDCGHDQIYDLLRAGELDSYVEGTRRKVTMASIERLVAKRLATTGGEYRRGPHVPPLPPRGKKQASSERPAA
jgi:hypothetical protein